jgi:hypothetical protein
MFFCACHHHQKASYKVFMSFKNSDSIAIRKIQATDDEAAFKNAVLRFWSRKVTDSLLNDETYKNTKLQLGLPEPLAFKVYKYAGMDSTIVSFDAEETNKISASIIDSARQRALLIMRQIDSAGNPVKLNKIQ